MQGRNPTGIACVFGNCADPAKEAELNRWYVEMHIPDVTKPGIFPLCTRFENPTAKGGAESPKYLAIYETTRPDPAAAWTENRTHTAPLREQGRISPHMKSTLVAVFKRMGPAAGAPGRKKTTGALVVLTDCKDPAREAEFNKWYDQVHLGDIIGTGLYFAAARYVNTGLTPGQPKYLAIYETDRPDPIGALAELQKLLVQPPLSTRRTDTLALRLSAPFKLTYSQADALAVAKAGAARR